LESCAPETVYKKVGRYIGLITAPSDKKDGGEKPPPTNWAKVYSTLLFHSGIHYEEIARRTLPQINALLAEAPENISIKIGMPNIFGGVSDGSTSNGENSSQEDIDSFFNDF
jgi:hypothetical protein